MLKFKEFNVKTGSFRQNFETAREIVDAATAVFFQRVAIRRVQDIRRNFARAGSSDEVVDERAFGVRFNAQFLLDQRRVERVERRKGAARA